MSDPAVEAAQRAWAGIVGSDTQAAELLASSPDSQIAFLVKAAAREALAPIRALHHRLAQYPGDDVCSSCYTRIGFLATWPCDTAKLVYPSEEL
ncbi:hypothetical protein HH308_06430 [Gordonia sp. TBRC 11910]|uniref:Uncharacterized protein n=1 Tax=Gordonia asplenii TaxID=2725283 RepID=A0A848KRW9_9ACTN|nr:hypothetical protein [Gordonia asplenii]NMO00849.1 hypothetical protein [Gordonia asplenii]